jgi:hypothetical protein
LNSLQLQFMPFFSYSCLIREGEQLVTILHTISHGIMKVVIESLASIQSRSCYTDLFPGELTKMGSKGKYIQTYSHLVKYWTEKLFLEWILISHYLLHCSVILLHLKPIP